jgi:hypothetical protein
VEKIVEKSINTGSNPVRVAKPQKDHASSDTDIGFDLSELPALSRFPHPHWRSSVSYPNALPAELEEGEPAFEHSVTRLERLNLTDSQRRDAITYEPGLIVEFHKISRGAVHEGVKEKRFKSGEQWEVLRREEGTVIVGKDGKEKQLPLDQARKFSVFRAHAWFIGTTDRLTITSKFEVQTLRTNPFDYLLASSAQTFPFPYPGDLPAGLASYCSRLESDDTILNFAGEIGEAVGWRTLHFPRP